MHILFVTGEYPPMQGGVGAYTDELANALVEEGARVSVVTSRAADLPATPGSPVQVYPLIDRWNWSIRKQIGRLATEIGADWLHVQYQTAAYALPPAINSAPGTWRQRFRVAWTYHDLLVPYLFPKAGSRLRRWVTHRPATESRLTIVTNEGDYLQLANRSLPRLEKIPIGSNIRARLLDRSGRKAHRAQLGYGESDLLLGYFGFLNRSKGGTILIEVLQELAQELPDVRLLMIGERVGASDPTNYAYLQEVEATISRLGMEDRVQWTGRRDDELVGADLNACDILLMPYQDGASLRRGTLMAGLANGCAIVTSTPQSPLPELVHGRDLMYADPDDVTALTATVRAVADDPLLAQTLRVNARDRSLLFQWPRIASRHAELYAECSEQG